MPSSTAHPEMTALLRDRDSELSPGLGRTVQPHIYNNPLLGAPMLSPLLPGTPYSGRNPLKDFTKFSYENFVSEDKHYEALVIDHSTLEKGPLECFTDDTHTIPKSKFREDDQWDDPGQGIGRTTLVCLVAAAVGLLGFMLFMGKAMDGTDSKSEVNDLVPHLSHPPVQSVLEAFPFSPSHFLPDCASQIQKQQNDSSKFIANQSSSAPGTYFSASQSEKVVEKQIKYSEVNESGTPICAKSLTYLLDDDFGFTFHLNAISLAAALAEKDSRSFFIVDANWDRGAWSDHFIKTPDPRCAPPPPSEMAGCPRTTRHWILTSSIFAPHFSKEFQLNFGNNNQMNEKTSNPPGIIPYTRESIFEMARSTFLRLFVLSDEDDFFIRQTKQDIIKSSVWGSSLDGYLPPFISVHIRKGDRHPQDPLHKFDYVPINDFVDGINSTWIRLRDADPTLPESPNVYLASDTPLVLEQIRAITPEDWKFFHLSEAQSPNISMIAHPHEYSQLHFHAHVLSERLGYTRGQIIDMAFLGGGWPKADGSVRLSSTDFDKPLASICTVSSNMCQFGALQLGWSEAFENKRWINLDLPLSASWQGIEIPAPNSGDSNPNGHGHGAAHHGGAHHS